jgi:amino acid transporter
VTPQPLEAGQALAGGGLQRTLTRKDLIVYGLAILTPTAAYPVFGVVQQESHGHAALSYLTAMVAMLLTAASYGKMAVAFPVAGSTYSYAQQALHPAAGFLAGWAMILDYVLVPLLSAIFVSLTAHRLVPGVPFALWAFLFCGFVTILNIRGMHVTKRANEVMLFLMCLSAIWFVVAAAVHTGSPGGLFRATAVYDPSTFALRPLMLGAGIATLSYLGFDAVSTLAEEAKDPRSDVRFATVFVCILQTLICFAVAYLATIVWPAAKPFPDVETAILDISRVTGGQPLFGFNTVVLMVAGIASSLASVAGASRMLYGMGRDRMLPPAVFAHLDTRFATPVRSILLMGVISFAGALLISFQQVVELVNFGAFAGFILVNCSVIAHYYIRKRERSGIHLLTNLILPLLGAGVCIYVWLSLSPDAKRAGFAWLAVGVVYLAILTKGFSRPARRMELV